MVYQLRPAGTGTSEDFYFYVSHARSTSDDADGDARYAEAQAVRSDAKYNLPAGAHMLYAGTGIYSTAAPRMPTSVSRDR